MFDTRKIWENAGYICLAGFFLSTTFSKALAQMLLGGVLFAAVVLFFQEKIYRRPLPRNAVFWFICTYVAWSIISSFFGTNPLHSISYLFEDWLFLCIPAIALMITGEKRLFILVDAFVFSVVVLSVYGLAQHYWEVDWYIALPLVIAPESGFRAQGFFSSIMTYGNFFAVATMFILGCALHAETYKRRLYYYGGTVLAAFAALLSYGRGPMGGIIIGVLVCLFYIPRRFLKYAAILPVFFATVVYLVAPDILSRHIKGLEIELEGKAIWSRQAVWRTAGRMIEAHPLFGVGRGNFTANSEIYRDEGNRWLYTHAHNYWLNVAAVSGIPTLIPFVGMWLAVLVRMKTTIGRLKEPRPLRGVLVGCLLASLVLFSASFYEAIFDDIEIRLLLTGIWGVFFGATALVKKNGETADDREIA